MNIAVLHYDSKHGTDTILFVTEKTETKDLPRITKNLLHRAGVFDPFSEDESAEWVHILPVDQLPKV